MSRKVQIIVAALCILGMMAIQDACDRANYANLASDVKLLPFPCGELSSDRDVRVDIISHDGLNEMCLVDLPQQPHRWRWSLDGKKLAYEIRAEKADHGEVYLVNADGTGLKNLGPQANTWYISPDGRFIGGSGCRPSGCAVWLDDVETGEKICSGWRGPADRYRMFCPGIRLADGRWWSPDFRSVIVKTNSQRLWALIANAASYPDVSPDGQWMIGRARGFGDQPGGWYVASTDGESLNWYSLPKEERGPCYDHYSALTAWSPDSQRFAVSQEWEKRVFIIALETGAGNARLLETIELDRCPYDLEFTAEGSLVSELR